MADSVILRARLITLVVAVYASIHTVVHPAETPARSTAFVPFIAYGASASSREIIAVRYDMNDGKLVPRIVQREAIDCEGAPVVFHPKHRLIYVASLRNREGGQNQCVVFAVGPDGKLTRRSSVPFEHGSAYLSLDRSGRFLLSASYFDGDVDVYRLDAEGIPTDRVHHHHEGRDKAHAILTTPDNRFGYVPYVKDQNALYQYRFDARTGKLTPLSPARAELPDGIGPRHVAYHPSKPFVYFSNEQHLGVTSYRIGSDGGLTLVGVCHAGDLRSQPSVFSSDIAVTPDGRFVFVGVRGFGKGLPNYVARYRIKGDGSTEHLGNSPADAVPWGVHVSPCGGYLFVSAFEGGTLTAYRIGRAGELSDPVAIDWGKQVRDTVFVMLKSVH